MEYKHYDTLILGATFLGVGIALSSKGTSIIVERTSLVGSEFVDSFDERIGKNFDIKTPFAKQYKESLLTKKLINDTGDIYTTPAMFVLCDYIKKNNLKIHFLTEVTQINKTDNGYEVTLFNCDGFSTIYANKIIDTTSTGILHDTLLNSNAKKYLNAIIFAEGAFPNELKDHVTTNPITKISVFHFPVELNDGWFLARQKFFNYLDENQDLSHPFKVALISSAFAYHLPPTRIKLDDQHLWVPSCSYENLLHAFDEGGTIC